MLLTLIMYVFNFSSGSLCVTLDLVPLVWKLGFGYETAGGEAALMPGKVLSVNFPTLCLELRWANTEDLEKARKIMEENALDRGCQE